MTIIIKVLVNDVVIGAIQSMSVKTKYSEDGYQQLGVSLEVSRMRLDKLRLGEAFSRGFVHVAAQKYPLQIAIEEDKVEVGRVTNAWINSIGYTYNTNDWVLAEDIELEAEHVSGVISSTEIIS